jgi:hypothetical protein
MQPPIISSNIDDLLVPDLSCYNCGDCSISKIQRCKKVEFIGSHKRVTMEENVCESNDEHVSKDWRMSRCNSSGTVIVSPSYST